MHLQEAELFIRKEKQRQILPEDLLAMVRHIDDWRIRRTPIIDGIDRERTVGDLVKYLIDEIVEAQEAFENLQKFKLSNKENTPENRRQLKILQDKFVGELADVLVFMVSIWDKAKFDYNPNNMLDIESAIIGANGQSLEHNIFSQLKVIAENIDNKNVGKQLFHGVQMLFSYINHSSLNINFREAVVRKIEDNYANRDFDLYELKNHDRSRFTTEQIDYIFAYHNLFSKELRKMFSAFLVREVNPLERWMKEPFADLYKEIFLFKFSGIEEARSVIQKRFLEFVRLLAHSDRLINSPEITHQKLFFYLNEANIPHATILLLRNMAKRGGEAKPENILTQEIIVFGG